MKDCSFLLQIKMAASLEEILEQATDANNTMGNQDAAEAFANQINKEFDGSQRAVKLIIQRIGLHNEIITLQALNVLECCVENCGQKFHQEIGKYRFLNELIKLLSPKYDGGITSETIKTQLIKLFYGWSIGLPKEVKIAEAYKMLKQQGVIKRDPIPDSQEAMISKPRNTTLEDEEKSQLLSTLLKSSNPEDLQAANRLIKTMVKQEEERLEKVSKRVQDLETVSNNVRLLTDMLSAYNSSLPDNEKETTRYLYESCLSMRTQLFRMASSSADERDDTLSEILSLSDDLTKAVDEYKLVVLQGGQSTLTRQGAGPKTTEDYPATDYTAAGDSLLDLGLDMQQSPAVPDDSLGSATNTSASLLDDQFKLLGLDADTTQPNNTTAGSKATTDAQWGVLGPGQSGTQQQQPHPQIQVPTAYYHVNSASMPYAMNMNANMSGQMMAPAMLNTMQSGMMLSSVRPVSSFAASSGASVQTATQQTRPVKPPGNEPKNVYKDPLAFDVFSNFKKDGAKPNLTDAAKGSDETNYVMNTDLVNDATRPVAQPITANDAPIDTLLDFSDYEAKQSKPLSSDGYIVPLEAIEPTSHAPITALDKNGVKTMLNIVKDKRDTANANVIVAVLSTISMNVVAISDFKIEISVPKVMRVKMQAPSSRNLPAFNPLFPPSAITQVILIANPTKETIKMQLRISYKSGENALSETVTIDSLPVT